MVIRSEQHKGQAEGGGGGRVKPYDSHMTPSLNSNASPRWLFCFIFLKKRVFCGRFKLGRRVSARKSVFFCVIPRQRLKCFVNGDVSSNIYVPITRTLVCSKHKFNRLRGFWIHPALSSKQAASLWKWGGYLFSIKAPH